MAQMQAGPKSDNTMVVLSQIMEQHGFTSFQAAAAAKLMCKNEGRGAAFLSILSDKTSETVKEVVSLLKERRDVSAKLDAQAQPAAAGDDQAVSSLLDGLSRLGVGDTQFKKETAFVREIVEVRFRSLKKVLTGHVGHVSLFIQAGHALPSLSALVRDLLALRGGVESAELALLTRFSPVESVKAEPYRMTPDLDEEFEPL